jgi:hypothetical protein
MVFLLFSSYTLGALNEPSSTFSLKRRTMSGNSLTHVVSEMAEDLPQKTKE